MYTSGHWRTNRHRYPTRQRCFFDGGCCRVDAQWAQAVTVTTIGVLEATCRAGMRWGLLLLSSFHSLSPRKPYHQTSTQIIPSTDFDIVCALLPSLLHCGAFSLSHLIAPGFGDILGAQPPLPESFFYPTVHGWKKLPVPGYL